MRLKFTPYYWDHHLKIPWFEHKFMVQQVLETYPSPTTTSFTSPFSSSSSFRRTAFSLRRLCSSSCTRSKRTKKYLPLFTSPQRTALLQFIQARQTSKPLQYVLGWTPFLHLTIKTVSPCLIPRHDTEHWTHELILKIQSSPTQVMPKSIMDIGCGTGCIGLALVKTFPFSKLFAYDCQEKAIQLAQFNAQRNQCQDRCHFYLADVFGSMRKVIAKKTEHPTKFSSLCISDVIPTMTSSSIDLLVSNPPYLSKKEWEGLPHEVQHWEDPIALIGGDSGMEYYPLLFKLAQFLLSPRLSHSLLVPCFAVELGHAQGPSLHAMALKYFHKVELGQDLAGRNRYLFGYGLKR